MTLDEIALTTSTDKSSRFHDYCRTYDELFSPLRELPVRLLEMGVLGGDSLVMWSEYFSHPDTRIIGIDIETHRCQPIEGSRVSVIPCSQTDPSFWQACKNGGWDICIDDGGHFSSQQQVSFLLGWKTVNRGGLYCIEDLHTYASEQHSDTPENVMQWLTRIATEMQGRGAEASGKVDALDTWNDIDVITFRKGLCIIRKAR